MIPLDALPADVLDLIRRYYLASRRADQKHHASARLQACLRRHLTQRCEDPCKDPAHAGFVTYSCTPCLAERCLAERCLPQRCLAERCLAERCLPQRCLA